MTDPNAENIRKQLGRQDPVGSSSERDDVLDRIWGLRERMRRLGIEFEDGDEWIRITVDGSDTREMVRFTRSTFKPSKCKMPRATPDPRSARHITSPIPIPGAGTG